MRLSRVRGYVARSVPPCKLNAVLQSVEVWPENYGVLLNTSLGSIMMLNLVLNDSIIPFSFHSKAKVGFIMDQARHYWSEDIADVSLKFFASLLSLKLLQYSLPSSTKFKLFRTLLLLLLLDIETSLTLMLRRSFVIS